MGERDRRLDLARQLRLNGIESLKLAADIEALVRHDSQTPLPLYVPVLPVLNNIEAHTGRFACCGAGTDRTDARTGEREHFPGCRKVAAEGIALCREMLDHSEDAARRRHPSSRAVRR